MNDSTQEETIERAEKMLLLPRADWCVLELERSAKGLKDHAEGSEEILFAARGTSLMARTMGELREALGRQAALAERLGSGARFLCDLLQGSNESIEALYGGEFDAEQAVIELRAAIKAWEESR